MKKDTFNRPMGVYPEQISDCDRSTIIRNGDGDIKLVIKEDMQNNRQFDTGAVRDRAEGKGRCDLLPAAALLRLAKHYENGANKYGARNWEKGQPVSVLMDSGMRHMLKYLDGWTDEDHLAAAAWNILGAMWMEEKRPEMQDIPTRGLRAKIGTIDESNLTSTGLTADKIVTGTIDTVKIPLFKVGQKVKYKTICYSGYQIGNITGIVQVLDHAHGDGIGKMLYYVEKSNGEVVDTIWEEDLELVGE